MRKTLGIIAVLTLILGVACGVVAAKTSQQAFSIKPIEQPVELQVNELKWTELTTFTGSDGAIVMMLDLTEPGAHDETFRPITVAANTEVTVSVKWSQPLSLVGDAADPNLEKRPLRYELGFRGSNADLAVLNTEYTVGAGQSDTRELVFRAWWESDNWYQLLAGEYRGTATITVSAVK